ncbi:MAG: DUF3987 domain-containing protein [Parabacteroides sp.]|jgi:hypothetical protein|nr:hypothetical protein HMPREF0999_02107 [Parabacteroides sp. D25]KMW35810.1 hypothetical protein BSDG_02010 [Parabacteroides sp. 2_1_7]MBS7102219.1 DUF3987 domain-containing protein [Parabacteroides sp.]MCE9025059.1 DUF3987 domain-containing protein [Parabacteroides distasonis]RKU61719.1 DUF3987 domain-containing protein [Parabacteroides sp. OF01-14]
MIDDAGAILPVDGLSPNATEMLRKVASSLQCPVDIALSAMFATVGVAMGKRVIIDDGKYRNYPCLWVCVVAPSGSNKSTPIRFFLQPLKDRDSYNYGVYREELRAYRQAGDDKGDKPVFKQYVISDSTPEARNQVLSVNPNGILLYRDELKGMIDDFCRYAKSGELSQMLSMFDSDTIVVNRKSDEPLLIKDPFMSIIGSIQPSVLVDTFGNDNMMNNGFNQRWLFCYPESGMPEMYNDVSIPQSVISDWKDFIYNLIMYDFSVMGGKIYIRGEAKRVYIDYYNSLQIKKASADDYLSSVYSKLQIHVIRWAGVAHILGNSPTSIDITPEEMEYSVRCMDYFERCALKVYRMLLEGRGNRHEVKSMGKEEMIANVYHCTSPVSQRAVADALGITKQYVSKCLKKYPKLTGCRLTDSEISDTESDTDKN